MRLVCVFVCAVLSVCGGAENCSVLANAFLFTSFLGAQTAPDQIGNMEEETCENMMTDTATYKFGICFLLEGKLL